MVAANLVHSVWRNLTLGVLIAGWFASAMRHAEAQDAATYNKHGIAWYQKGEYDRAIADFDQAIKLDPNYSHAYHNRGIAWEKKKRWGQSIADFTRAISLNPNDALAYNYRGLAWEEEGAYDRAIDDYNQAIRLDPKLSWAYNNRGLAWNEKKQYDRAMPDYVRAISLDSKNPGAYDSLAWLQATCPDPQYRNGKMAFENASRAYELSRNVAVDLRAGAMDTLAAAYAENGDFEKAREWQVKAIDLTPDKDKKREFQSRLELYKQKKPYRQEVK